MTAAEEKAEAYLGAYIEEYPEPTLMEGGWSDEAMKRAFAAGYQAAEKYRLLLQAAIRNTSPTA